MDAEAATLYSDIFTILCIVTFSLSSMSSIIMNLLLRKKESNYSKLMRYICISEALFIYCGFIIIIDKEHNTNESFSKWMNWIIMDL